MEKLIVASILSADFANLEREIREVRKAGADWVHIDVMDGHFVPNITVGSQVVAAVKRVTDLPLDVHLMVEHPEVLLSDFMDAGCDVLTIHVEASRHLHRLVDRIKSRNIKAGVSLNPATSLCHLDGIIGDVDLVLLMSVNPGFGGQTFIPASLQKIARLRAMRESLGANFVIEVDGGVNLRNAKDVANAGADVLVAGSAIFHSPDYRQTLEKMRADIALPVLPSEGIPPR